MNPIPWVKKSPNNLIKNIIWFDFCNFTKLTKEQSKELRTTPFSFFFFWLIDEVESNSPILTLSPFLYCTRPQPRLELRTPVLNFTPSSSIKRWDCTISTDLFWILQRSEENFCVEVINEAWCPFVPRNWLHRILVEHGRWKIIFFKD